MNIALRCANNLDEVLVLSELNTFNTVKISAIVPLYNESDGVEQLFTRLIPVLSQLQLDYEVICINDGSKDDTLAQLIGFSQENPRIKIVNLSRNFGKEIALTAGLDYASGAAVIPIDADLQDPPELIVRLIEKWREGYDVVYATRRRRVGEKAGLKELRQKPFIAPSAR